MDREEKLERLRGYLNQIAPRGGLETMAEEAGFESMVEGVESVSDQEQARAQQAVGKLAREESLEDDDLWTLEAIVLPQGRPVVDILNDSYTAPPGLWAHLGEPEVRQRIERAIPSVGRVELPDHPSLPFGGTGFVVGDGLIMTNRHVAELFATGLGIRGLLFRSGLMAGLDFRRENQTGDPIFVDVREVAMIHPFWDMALLRVEGLPERQQPLELDTTHPEDLQSREVVVIGYPAQDLRNDLQLQNQIFRGVYNVKRLQPGKLAQRSEIRSFGNRVSAATHDSSTLGGNSGSAVIDIQTGRVVGLHFAGLYLKSNYAVPTHELARDSFVVDTGVNFSGSVEDPSIPWIPNWKAADPPGEEGRAASQPAPQVSATVSGLQSADAGPVTWTIPLQITVNVGQPALLSGVAVGVPTQAEVEAPKRKIKPDPNYDLRPGYDREFLGAGHRVRLPFIARELFGDVAFNRRATRDRHVLPYHHFSVVMNRRRRLAFFTAVNIDGTKEKRVPRPQDEWFVDPRIGAAEQLQNDLYVSNPLDRGHLVRRLDATWGDTFQQAVTAEDDTFHWTNCSPQHENFNRNRSTWGGVENFILNSANNTDRRVTVFTGPVFGDDDPVYTTRDGDEVPLPLSYWKVVAMVKDGGQLSATAYLISQKDLVGELLEAPSFRIEEFQTTVREIERMTQLSFDQLRDFDPLDDGTEAAAITPKRIELTSLESIVI